jgi:amidase
MTWQDIANSKREAILVAIPQEWRISNLPSVEEQPDVTTFVEQYLSKEELGITACSADKIAQKCGSGEWTAETVTRAFCHRASIAHQLLHCLHEIFFDAAIKDAKKLDAYYAEHKRTKGPLHGVPVSLKDQFHVKDVETSMGYVGWIGTFEGKKGTGKEKVYESEMVAMLRNAGAVLYCKTSVPHTLMSGETVNNIIGYTLNPKNRRLTAGGSSGGEGALIGIRGCKFTSPSLPTLLIRCCGVVAKYCQHLLVWVPILVAQFVYPLPSTVSTVSVRQLAVFHIMAWQTAWTVKTAFYPSSVRSPRTLHHCVS